MAVGATQYFATRFISEAIKGQERAGLIEKAVRDFGLSATALLQDFL